MPKKTPQVSFVIRTKNEARFIGKVLKYLYQQTFKNFEVIIVDSGSTDRTLEIVKKFPVKIIKIKPEDFNFSWALNLGISKSKGEIIGIISGHSIPASNDWLKNGIVNFEDQKIAGVTGCTSSNPLPFLWRPLGFLDFIFYKARAEFIPNMTNTAALICKRMWEIYPFDETLPGAEDYDWGSEMIARGYKVVRDKKFSAYHSHIILGRKLSFMRRPMWRRWRIEIDKRKRPRKFYTRLKTKKLNS